MGVGEKGERERPFVAGIDDAGEVDRKPFAVDRRARVEDRHEIVGDFYRLEGRDEHVLLRQKLEVLSLLELDDIEIFRSVIFEGVDAQGFAALGRHLPRLRNKEREAEPEVDRVRLELEGVEAGSKNDIALLHAGEYFGFGQDGHGSPLYPPTGTRRRRALGGVSQARGPGGRAAAARAEKGPPKPAEPGAT